MNNLTSYQKLIIVLLGIIILQNGCLYNNGKKNQKSLTQIPTKSELEIVSLKIKRDVLYDQNAIVRSVTRPDDKINEYNKKIDELEIKK